MDQYILGFRDYNSGAVSEHPDWLRSSLTAFLKKSDSDPGYAGVAAYFFGAIMGQMARGYWYEPDGTPHELLA